jgi:SAM-dependent methyltransferase
MPLPLTGERTVPGLPHENYWFRRHQVAYRTAAHLCQDAAVLEAGAGEGYGTALIRAAGATTVVALDYDATAIAHAAKEYGVPAIQGNLVALPFRDGAFDVVLSLQTVEHLWNQEKLVAECARVLRPGGRLVLTTPNRLTFPPGNPFHTRELTASELTELVATAPLKIDAVLGVHHGRRLATYPGGLATYPGSLVADQLATEPDAWPAELATFVASITADDFDVTSRDLDTSLDLYLVAVRT